MIKRSFLAAEGVARSTIGSAGDAAAPKHRPRIVRGVLTAAAMTVALAGVAVGTESSAFAATAGSVTPQSTSCQSSKDFARTWYSTQCSSNWPWESFDYWAEVFCTDGLWHFGDEKQSYFNDGWSVARCPSGYHWVQAGRGGG
jgi:hypothetical protein